MDHYITKLNNREVINSLKENIAVLDLDGTIISVNEAWVHYGFQNGVPKDYNWIGVNYLAISKHAVATGDDYARKSVEGMKAIQNGESNAFSYEYPCHTDDEARWFLFMATPLQDDLTKETKGIVVSHIDITARKLTEIKLEEALEKINTLKGLIPICASCKSIRDDQDYWTKLETFIEAHTDTSFTHDICPSCLNDILEQ
ncbi:PAS domain-containing protein [Aquibacillus koreensis]|uniref:PAS domain-containing protein n=1 Tax=Aquibacillus koreensis TaxID=279446 RepID=A0A9X3WLC7_9BACI|nr:PAS domain-containing protein [Aquibacillus koreensis]MCT2534232.1 PAS domain-containing protein [Aquibacillus koreensis]MDC3420723.1 PAS domain-containing protein [Aquibacillus koreensis]